MRQQFFGLLIFITLFAASRACSDAIDLPPCDCTSSTPRPTTPTSCPPTCDSTKKWVCVCDPHCRQNKNPFNWQLLSECELQIMQKHRDSSDLARYIFLRTISEGRCAVLNKKKGLFGCCQRNLCPNKCGCPTMIRNYPCCCGSLN